MGLVVDGVVPAAGRMGGDELRQDSRDRGGVVVGLDFRVACHGQDYNLNRGTEPLLERTSVTPLNSESRESKHIRGDHHGRQSAGPVRRCS